MKRPVAQQIAAQCRATLAMLPYASVSGLGELDPELLATVFGQTMQTLNELPDLHRFVVAEHLARIETQREYWRRKQREHRAARRKDSVNAPANEGTTT